ncbi:MULTISPECIES: tyrosine-type recombinase/integrase [Enterobacter]|uniref:tyrosine-type recombinase/integrase n=1 Tax=Enterobacter TaxID=547 RepID=UPI0011E68262|nr:MULTISPECIES: site-specific integrase [Enterobacter]MBG0522062.1 tyrosine-type recombinase/integrase [Enterobacter cloacae]MEB7930808.1 tyrosine-type recombinase/integrase [Enterobacter quasiroggenkampii]TYR27184.1 tyrosine-type recombinase/integrase [Enterobacter cloacae]
MPKLTDIQIRSWIKSGERFEGRADGNGLYLRYRKVDKSPNWRYRYRYAGKARAMLIGSYSDLSLAKARDIAKELSARVALGYDVAGEKQERKLEALAKIEAEKNALSVAELAAEYYARQIENTYKHPELFRSSLQKNIVALIGKMKVEDVRPRHVDVVLQDVIKRGSPTVANDVLRMLKRLFDYAVVRGIIEVNPAISFSAKDAGGKEQGRKRALSREELMMFFRALRNGRGISRENELAFKIILALGVRKMELCAAEWSEFDLANEVWHLPGSRAKNGDDIDIPLPQPVIEWIKEIRLFAGDSRWLIPARRAQTASHISRATLNMVMPSVMKEMSGVEPFSIHDLRRTMRTQMAGLGIDPLIAERCLNHKIPGIEGIYNRHQYFNERKAALAQWADLLVVLENGDDDS